VFFVSFFWFLSYVILAPGAVSPGRMLRPKVNVVTEAIGFPPLSVSAWLQVRRWTVLRYWFSLEFFQISALDRMSFSRCKLQRGQTHPPSNGDPPLSNLSFVLPIHCSSGHGTPLPACRGWTGRPYSACPPTWPRKVVSAPDHALTLILILVFFSHFSWASPLLFPSPSRPPVHFFPD